MNCSASALAWGFSGVFHSRGKAKSLKSWLLNGGLLSLLTDTGMPIFSITNLALVEVAIPSSAHLNCFHSVTTCTAVADTLQYGWDPQSLLQHLPKAYWACTMVLPPATHLPLDMGGSAGYAYPPFCPAMETTLWYAGTPWSWWHSVYASLLGKVIQAPTLKASPSSSWACILANMCLTPALNN